MIRLFDDNELLTDDGYEWSTRVQEALKPVLESATSQNISTLDMRILISDAVNLWAAGTVLRREKETITDRFIKNLKEKKDD